LPAAAVVVVQQLNGNDHTYSDPAMREDADVQVGAYDSDMSDMDDMDRAAEVQNNVDDHAADNGYHGGGRR
jgi:hypothetical protein